MARAEEKHVVRPFLRWAGSKRQLIPKLATYWDEGCARYIEPFMGSASLFFALGPKAAVLSDINSELVQAFVQVRDNPVGVWEEFQPLRRSKSEYYRMRALDPKQMTPAEAAARFIYLNRYCFNGLYRTNRAGRFNVPYSRSAAAPPSKEALLACGDALGAAKIRCADFAETASLACEGDFVYMDPPFAVTSRRVFKEYSPDPFDDESLNRLVVALDELDAKGARFVVSYADSAEGRRCLGKWKTRRVRTRRNIAGFAKDRRYAYEIIATNVNPDRP